MSSTLSGNGLGLDAQDVRRPGGIHVLEADPDLAAGVPGDQVELATRYAVAPLLELERGLCAPFPEPDRGGLGGLVLAGMILIRMEADSRAHVELLGEGDVISPWVETGLEVLGPTAITAHALTGVRLARLNRAFALRIARWPEIHAELIRRLVIRSRRLSVQSAINSRSRTEERVELTLWQLAHRFGRVTRNGLTLHLPITHSQLAEMVAAQRPSVSTAITRLESHGRIVRTGRHDWLLRSPSALARGADTDG